MGTKSDAESHPAEKCERCLGEEAVVEDESDVILAISLRQSI